MTNAILGSIGWAASVLMIATASVAGDPDLVFFDGFEPPPPGPTPAWQLLYGRPGSGGVFSDKDGIVAIDTDSSGNLYALMDRRFADRLTGRELILIEIDQAGSLIENTRFNFSRNVEPKDLRRLANGDLIIAIDDQLLRLNALGELVWGKTLKREPFAFGGMNIRRVRTDDQGNIYVVGDFNPSEPGNSRAFLAKLSGDGEGQWLRSWDLGSFERRIRLSVSGDGEAWVTSRRPDDVDFDVSYSVYGFDTAGALMGQTAFTHPGNLNIRIRHLDTVVTETGVLVQGLFGPRVGGEFRADVFEADLDAMANVLSLRQNSWLIDSRLQGVERVSDPVVTTDGKIVTVFGAEDSYAVLSIDRASSSRLLYSIQRSDTSTPFIDDDDHPVFVAAAEGGTVRIGGTSELPDIITTETLPSAPISADIAELKIDETIFADTLVVEDGAESFTTGSDMGLGVINDPEVGDQDALLISLPLQ